MKQVFKLIAVAVGVLGTYFPYRIFAQVPTVVNGNLFVNSNGNAVLFPISSDSRSLGQVIFIRGIQLASVAIGVVSIAYLIYGAIQFSTAAGDEAKIEQAKKSLIWSIVGIAVFMMTFLIISATQNASQGNL